MAETSKKAKSRNRPPRVGIVMGSDSDLEVMAEAASVLKRFGIPFQMTVASAHRSPSRAAAFASEAKDRGMGVIIAGAGHSALKGLDALFSTVQMPPGIPVATMAIGKPGARNAGILAAQILALSDKRLAGKLAAFKEEMAAQVEEKARKVEAAGSS